MRIAIDDPVAAGATAIEMGVPLAVIADDQWHLYQWNFADADHWDPLGNAGSDGVIDALAGTVTIDSIWLGGTGSSQFYVDNVAHNPNGQLVPEPCGLLLFLAACGVIGAVRTRRAF